MSEPEDNWTVVSGKKSKGSSRPRNENEIRRVASSCEVVDRRGDRHPRSKPSDNMGKDYKGQRVKPVKGTTIGNVEKHAMNMKGFTRSEVSNYGAPSSSGNDKNPKGEAHSNRNRNEAFRAKQNSLAPAKNVAFPPSGNPNYSNFAKGKPPSFNNPSVPGEPVKNDKRDSAACASFKNERLINTEPKSLPKAAINSHNQTKSESTPTLPSGAPEVTTAPKKKKKRASKEARRRNREDKYFQALNQKDSHVHFVSAEMMKQMRQKEVVLKSPQKPMVPYISPYADPPLLIAEAQAKLPKWRPHFCIEEEGSGGSSSEFPALTPSKISKDCNTEEVTPVKDEDEDQDHHQAPLCKPPSAIMNFPSPLCTSSEVTNITPSPSVTKGKKSKQPLFVDITALIVQKSKEPEKKTPQTGLGKHKENHKLTAGNPLDSSGPGVIHRGKIRQKKKKPTKLKMTILRTRTLRKILAEGKSIQENVKDTLKDPEVENAIISRTEQEPENVSEPVIPEEENEDLPIQVPELNPDTGEETEEPTPEVIEPINSQNEYDEIIEDLKSPEIPSLSSEVESPDFTAKFVELLHEMSMLEMDNTEIPKEVEVAVKNSLHSRKFRDYCDMMTSKEMHKLVTKLLTDLHRFQDRLYHTDPIKFKTKKRYVSGLKESLAYLNLNKVQLLIIAPDIEKNPEPGGLDERISQILACARSRNVPYVFSGNKFILGKPCKRKTPVSIIAVLDKQNCEDTFLALMEEASNLREKYQQEFLKRAKEITLENV